jgi:hypothetical protein
MLAASSRLRFAAVLSACACTLTAFCAPAHSANIDLSLNIFYTNPGNTSSGGTWELVAKSSPSPSSFGISGLDVRLTNINSGSVIQGPRGIVNGSNIAGFQLLDDSFHAASPPTPAYRDLVIGQLPIFPLPAGNEESYLYGVGTLTNGAPDYPGKPAGSNSIGPTFTSFTNPQGIAWAMGDAFGDAAWNTAARMVSGTFNAGVSPAFLAGNSGNVFTSVGTSTTLGNEALATLLTTIVRTNAAASADYNLNGVVDAADYVLWRKTLGNVVPVGTGADGNRDGMINSPDYDLWRLHFGNPSGAGAGGSLSTNNIPEPAGCILITIGALLAIAPRRPLRSFSETRLGRFRTNSPSYGEQLSTSANVHLGTD